ncbi:sialidase family protein [Blastopirellula marina]|uniref:Exo-alpha-sialidase n=1 Tax=Blastopirellula marina TaxID=124 RepID=A0A2S8F6H9_9BACT|nr:sialidase family protein [Blastopirellula marina]PQO27769.1 exo-alpha-sialidase [Blastopirellula marina]PTL41509.1 exo-alpha-sialidase [Blastopirellula marina]
MIRFALVILALCLVVVLESSAGAQDSDRAEANRRQELKVLREVADLALLPPVLNTDPLPKYAVANLAYGMTIGIERTPKGRLFAAWIGGEDGPKAYMLVAKSDDDGQTWSEPLLVIDSRAGHLPLPRSVIVGNLWTDPLGRLWVFFDQTMNHFDGRGGLWFTRCDEPDADTLVWTEPKRIWQGSMLNKPTVLENGEWVIFAQLLQSNGFGPFSVGLFPELEPMRGANLLVSTDQGETWTYRGGVKMPQPDWMEHRAIERKDGSLWMLTRTRAGPMLTISNDQGRTWSEPTAPPQIKHPAARFHLRKLASGKWLLVKHGPKIDQHQGRSHLTAWLSDDEGQTWYGGLMLDERKGVSYPDGFQAPDGSIYISYDWERSKKGHILLAKFTEADIAAGKLVREGSKLRQPIMLPGKLNPTP